ncbi:hypothetical protein PsYK624_103960 [Phanerochaete sordida]|uniref:Uncharacterized protein n=1 Tax=Phanerochaete sordida TaxID=48140 RepID=A0A9P3LGV2_9APHY|nr:hypothetical protein PsYK624_103960 [Phanerochaete sordida]
MQLTLLAVLAVLGLTGAVPTSLEGRQMCLPPAYCLLNGEMVDSEGKTDAMHQDYPCCSNTHCGSPQTGTFNLPSGVFSGAYAYCES